MKILLACVSRPGAEPQDRSWHRSPQRTIERGLKESSDCTRKINQTASAGHIQNAEEAHDSDLTAISFATPFLFVNEKKGVCAV